MKHLVNGFGNVPGLKLNEEKTEAYWLGSLHDSQEDLGIDKDKVNKPMKILGVFFTYDWQKFLDLNFESIIKSIKKSINAWRWRNLRLLGRIQIIKTFAMPKCVFRASQIPLTRDIIKEINAVLFNFVWNSGKDKIKRSTLISDYNNGGLRFSATCNNIRQNSKNHVHEEIRGWIQVNVKVFFDNYLSDFGGSFLLKCNYDVKFLPKILPKFCTMNVSPNGQPIKLGKSQHTPMS